MDPSDTDQRTSHPAYAARYLEENAPLLLREFREGRLRLQEAVKMAKAGITTTAAVQHYRETGSLARAVAFERWSMGPLVGSRVVVD